MEFFNFFDWVVLGFLGIREYFRDFYEEFFKIG